MLIMKSIFLIAFVLVSTLALATNFDPATATDAYLASVNIAEIANTNGYVNAGYQIMVLAVVLELLIAFFLLNLGWSRKWRDLAERKLNNRFLQAFIYVPIYVIVTSLVSFPLTWFAEFYIEHKYGLATQEFTAWFIEYLQSSAISVVGVTIFAALLYLVIRKSPMRWWIWGTGLTIGSFAFILFIGPIYVQPIFNDYQPMDEGPLKERILSLARANGMDVDDVKQVDQSRQTNRVSANVSGFLGSSRIALNDNLINRASADAVEVVMAHEIGHYVLNHQGKRMISFTLIFAFSFAVVAGAFNAITRRKGEAWGIRGVDDYAGLPLLYALVTVLFFIMTPLLYKMIYIAEVEADLFAINATGKPDAWAEISLLTAEYRKLHPPQWEENWLNHHPSPYRRIYNAMVWKAENLPKGNENQP